MEATTIDTTTTNASNRGETMDQIETANIAKTGAAEMYNDEHLLWLACIVEAVDEDDERPVVVDDIEGRAIEGARLDYPAANLDRDREDVLAELVVWGCLERTVMRDRGFRSGYLPTEKGYAISSAENKAHPADCARKNDCEECYQAEFAKVRALDAIRYPWARPERLQWLREQIPTYPPLFSRKGTRAGVRGVLVLRVLPPVAFIPHLQSLEVETLRVGYDDDLRAAGRLPAGHPVATYLTKRTDNRVLVIWGEGVLAAHELPEAEGGIGFKVLVADPTWLDATTAPN